jgi:hypothetical protein
MPGGTTRTKFVYDNIKNVRVKSIQTRTRSVNTNRVDQHGQPWPSYTKTDRWEFEGSMTIYFLGDSIATSTEESWGYESSASNGPPAQATTSTSSYKAIHFYSGGSYGRIKFNNEPWKESIGYAGWGVISSTSSYSYAKTVGGVEIGKEFGGGSIPGYALYDYDNTSYNNKITILDDSPTPDPSPSPSPSPTPDPDCDCDYNAIAREMRSKHADLFKLVNR